MTACARKREGWACQTHSRASFCASINAATSSGVKRAQEVPGGGGVRQPASAHGVQERHVVAKPVDVFEHLPTGEHVVGHRQNVVGLVIRPMPREDVHPLVKSRTQADRVDQLFDQPDAARGNRAHFLAQLVDQVPSADHRRLGLWLPRRIQSRLQLVLPRLQNRRKMLHSKRPPCSIQSVALIASNHARNCPIMVQFLRRGSKVSYAFVTPIRSGTSERSLNLIAS